MKIHTKGATVNRNYCYKDYDSSAYTHVDPSPDLRRGLVEMSIVNDLDDETDSYCLS